MKKIRIFILFFIFTSITFAFSGKSSGTEKDPYQITNIKKLQELNNNMDAYYILMNDIDASETRNWNVGDHDGNPKTPDEPMGFEPLYFGGYLNGTGYIISNLYINRPNESAIGLFTQLFKSNIKKLGLENCDMTGGNGVSAFCAYNGYSEINECYITGKINSIVTIGSGSVSGFSYSNIGYITDCYSSCEINLILNTKSKENVVTGFSNCIIGGNSDCVRNSYTTGKVNIDKNDIDKIYSLSAFDNRGEHVYWDVETTGIPDSTIMRAGYVIHKGYSTQEMKLSKNYIGFDFKNVWYIKEEEDYPRLRAFLHPTKVDEVDMVADKLTIDISPCPATATAQIRYSAPYAKIIKIAITNIFGEEVAVHVSSQSHEAGQFLLELDVSAFPSGIYFCVLQTPAGAVTKQFVAVH
ncbi:MAG: hypothetical protein HW421_1819 [Ignavibacteria bacterium]|nr:hypothetical protein [Ignavibacteria bacterium]